MQEQGDDDHGAAQNGQIAHGFAQKDQCQDGVQHRLDHGDKAGLQRGRVLDALGE